MTKRAARETRVLHVVPSFFPAMRFGGPVVSTYQLCNSLAQDGTVEVRVLTTDTSGPKRSDRLDPTARGGELYPGYEVHFCRKVFGAAVAPGSLIRIWRDVAWADLVHITAVYSFTTIPALLASRVLGKPVVLSPHGALQRWAGTRLPYLKRAWNRICQLLMRADVSVLHVTSAAEAAASQEAMPRLRCEVIPHGVEAPAGGSREWLPGGRVRLLFVGRLDPIKGLENLLEAVAKLPSGKWALRICGHGEAEYVASLHARCASLGVEKHVSFAGFVEGPLKRAAYLGADLCVVPSFSENFSMVVVESLAHGTPVVASTGTPWQELDSRGAGRWVANDSSSLAAAISAAAGANLEEMGRKGRDWMTQDFAWPVIARRFSELYGDMLLKAGRAPG